MAPARARKSSRVARAPSSAIGTRTVESGGVENRAIGMSSKPATDTSVGTSMPNRRSSDNTPRAIVSVAANTAVGEPFASRRVTACAAPPTVKSARTIDGSTTSRKRSHG